MIKISMDNLYCRLDYWPGKNSSDNMGIGKLATQSGRDGQQLAKQPLMSNSILGRNADPLFSGSKLILFRLDLEINC